MPRKFDYMPILTAEWDKLLAPTSTSTLLR